MNPEPIAGRPLAPLYFEGALFGAMALFSTFMSSPWTIEQTATDHDKSAATRKYIWAAHLLNAAIGLFVAVWARMVAPLAGALIGTGIMQLTYGHARREGVRKGSSWWDDTGFSAGAGAAVDVGAFAHTPAGGRRR